MTQAWKRIYTLLIMSYFKTNTNIKTIQVGIRLQTSRPTSRLIQNTHSIIKMNKTKFDVNEYTSMHTAMKTNLHKDNNNNSNHFQIITGLQKHTDNKNTYEGQQKSYFASHTNTSIKTSLTTHTKNLHEFLVSILVSIPISITIRILAFRKLLIHVQIRTLISVPILIPIQILLRMHLRQTKNIASIIVIIVLIVCYVMLVPIFNITISPARTMTMPTT